MMYFIFAELMLFFIYCCGSLIEHCFRDLDWGDLNNPSRFISLSYFSAWELYDVCYKVSQQWFVLFLQQLPYTTSSRTLQQKSPKWNIAYPQTEAVKGQLASGSLPSLEGDISCKFPNSQSLKWTCDSSLKKELEYLKIFPRKKNIPDLGYYTPFMGLHIKQLVSFVFI